MRGAMEKEVLCFVNDWYCMLRRGSRSYPVMIMIMCYTCGPFSAALLVWRKERDAIGGVNKVPLREITEFELPKRRSRAEGVRCA
jgi:hypothetical protein